MTSLPKHQLVLGCLAVAAVTLVGCSDNDDDIDRLSGRLDTLENQPFNLRILHMNDHHSHLEAESLDYDVSGLGVTTLDGGGNPVSEVSVTYGGFPMLVSLFETLEGGARNVLKLHAGDAVTGTLYFTLFNGAADATMMNQVCFDAFALGNHEFDKGDSGLATFLDELRAGACDTPVLAANVVPASTSAIVSGYIRPYVIKQFGSESVGIIGIDIAQKTKQSSRPDAGTTFLDETTTAQQNIDTLKAAGVDKIVLMTHYQYANDLQLAANLSGVDVIVGGDSHTLLGDSTFTALGFSPEAAYPTQVTNADGEPVCVVHAWEYAHLLGSLDVTFDSRGVVTSCGGRPYLPVADSFVYDDGADGAELTGADAALVRQALTAEDEIVVTAADATTTSLLADYASQVAVLQEQVIGTVGADLCLERIPNQGRSLIAGCRELSYNRGSDISNIVAKAFMTVTPTADIGIQNAGGVRVDVAVGDYTIADAYTLLPFSNTLVTLDMSGQQIKDVLEDAVDFALLPDGSTGAYPYASGLRYDVDASQARGSRIANIEVNPRVAGTWSVLDLAATYTVVTNDFIASGQDGYDTFQIPFDAGDYVDTYTEYAQGFVDYVTELTAASQIVDRLPAEEYSTKKYIGRDGCDHSVGSDCEGY